MPQKRKRGPVPAEWRRMPVQLTPEQHEALTLYATRRRLSKAALIREAVEEYLAVRCPEAAETGGPEEC